MAPGPPQTFDRLDRAYRLRSNKTDGTISVYPNRGLYGRINDSTVSSSAFTHRFWPEDAHKTDRLQRGLHKTPNLWMLQLRRHHRWRPEREDDRLHRLQSLPPNAIAVHALKTGTGNRETRRRRRESYRHLPASDDDKRWSFCPTSRF